MMMYISYLWSPLGTMYNFGRYSIFIAIEVFGVFLLFKNFNKFNLNINFLSKENSLFRKFTLVLAKYSYGLYLVHFPLLRILMKILPLKTLHYKGSVLSLFVLDLIGSLLILYLFNKIPYINEYIGVK